jgi:hypothetical protein
VGGTFASAWNTFAERAAAQTAGARQGDDGGKAPKPQGAADEAVPDDMSTTSLVGGGLIAGDSIAALVLGVIGLLALVK